MKLDGITIPISFDERGLSLSIGSVKNQLVKFGADAAALGIIGGVGGAYVDFIKSTIEPAAESETANVRLAAALKATGRDAEISAPQLGEMATQLMKMSTFDDESIKGAFQTLSQFPSIPTSAFEGLTKAAMDLSAATGGDLNANIEGIGRALETGIIPRSWGFSAALKEQFKAQVDAGDSAGALALMMDELNARYGGQATAEVSTYAGQVKQLQNTWSEFKEGIGAEYIPALSGLLGWVNKNFDAIATWVKWIYTILNPLGALAAYIGKIAGNIGAGAPTPTPPKGGGGGWNDIHAKASGGYASGLTWVGERGPELVNLPAGSYVNNAQQSQAMGATYNVTIYNPAKETAEDSIAQQLKLLSYMGAPS